MEVIREHLGCPLSGGCPLFGGFAISEVPLYILLAALRFFNVLLFRGASVADIIIDYTVLSNR